MCPIVIILTCIQGFVAHAHIVTQDGDIPDSSLTPQNIHESITTLIGSTIGVVSISNSFNLTSEFPGALSDGSISSLSGAPTTAMDLFVTPSPQVKIDLSVKRTTSQPSLTSSSSYTVVRPDEDPRSKQKTKRLKRCGYCPRRRTQDGSPFTLSTTTSTSTQPASTGELRRHESNGLSIVEMELLLFKLADELEGIYLDRGSRLDEIRQRFEAAWEARDEEEDALDSVLADAKVEADAIRDHLMIAFEEELKYLATLQPDAVETVATAIRELFGGLLNDVVSADLDEVVPLWGEGGPFNRFLPQSPLQYPSPSESPPTSTEVSLREWMNVKTQVETTDHSGSSAKSLRTFLRRRSESSAVTHMNTSSEEPINTTRHS